jgi:hypothetical protein
LGCSVVTWGGSAGGEEVCGVPCPCCSRGIIAFLFRTPLIRGSCFTSLDGTTAATGCSTWIPSPSNSAPEFYPTKKMGSPCAQWFLQEKKIDTHVPHEFHQEKKMDTHVPHDFHQGKNGSCMCPMNSTKKKRWILHVPHEFQQENVLWPTTSENNITKRARKYWRWNTRFARICNSYLWQKTATAQVCSLSSFSRHQQHEEEEQAEEEEEEEKVL